MNQFTTCVTNWSRIDQLKGCLESLNPKNSEMDISLACFGAKPEHRKVAREIDEVVFLGSHCTT